MSGDRDETGVLRAELEGIRMLLRHALEAGRTAFSRDSLSYAAAAMAVIRLPRAPRKRAARNTAQTGQGGK